MRDIVTIGKVDAEKLARALLGGKNEADGEVYGICGKGYALLKELIIAPLGIDLIVDATDDQFYIGDDEQQTDDANVETSRLEYEECVTRGHPNMIRDEDGSHCPDCGACG